MDLTAHEAWQRLLDYVKRDMSEQTFRTWLEPAFPIELTGNQLLVRVADQFAADWNESKFTTIFASIAPQVLGHPCHVVFRADEERRQRSQMDLFSQPSNTALPSAASRRVAPPAPVLSARYTFDQFVIGKSNDVAAAAAHAVSQAPGKVYNPLFIYGVSGVGKTHLMQAIAHEILDKNPETRITFIGTEHFTNDLVSSIQNRSTAAFRRQYRETDLLLVDDIHFLKGKEATQEEFFHTFNALYEAGRQIVLTSDRPPSDISGLEGRLVSRFQWGMVADIELPDFEHRVAILKQKSHLDHLEHTIPDDVIRFIAENVRSSVRELEGSIIKLLAYASLKHYDISVPVAREALRDKLRIGDTSNDNGQLPLSITSIQQLVAREWGVTLEGLKSKTRTKTLTLPRQVAMFLTRHLLGTQLIEIGNAFGGRDHSTVIHSIEKITTAVQSDSVFKNRVEKVRSALESLR